MERILAAAFDANPALKPDRADDATGIENISAISECSRFGCLSWHRRPVSGHHWVVFLRQSPAVIFRILSLAMLCLLLGTASGRADESRDSTLVWDVTRQCFRPRGQQQAQCGVHWNVDTRRHEVPQPAAEAAPAAAVDQVVGGDVRNAEALLRNAEMHDAAALIQSVIQTRLQPTAPPQ